MAGGRGYGCDAVDQFGRWSGVFDIRMVVHVDEMFPEPRTDLGRRRVGEPEPEGHAQSASAFVLWAPHRDDQ